MRGMSEAITKMLKTFIGGQKRRSLSQVTLCPQGYIFAESATKIGKVVAYPKRGFRVYETLIFDMQEFSTKFKGFKIKKEEYATYECNQMSDRKVAFVNRALIVAETCVVEDQYAMMITKICGDQFIEQV